jgi:O-antigen chain-terminating methyltransferase
LSVAGESLADRLTRLERDRHEAATRYHAALDTLITWTLDTRGTMKDRVRAALWRVLGPPPQLFPFLDTVAAYVDASDRLSDGRTDVLNAGLSAITDEWLKRWESLNAREARFTSRLASLDDVGATSRLAQQTALALKRDVERLFASPVASRSASAEGGAAVADDAHSPPTARDLNAFKYVGFEHAFRGSEAEIRRRLEAYVPRFVGQSDVLDIGCGRGEFLDLLRAHDIPARGLDLNPAMVDEARSRGLDAVQADALAHLAGLPDAALGGVFASQVVEHLPPPYLMTLLETAAHKIRPGGLIVLETINPACWVAFFESFIRDVTHVWPLHPDTLQYFLRVSGFGHVEVEFTSPVDPSARLMPLARPSADADPSLIDLVETLNENAEKLNARLFTYQDYAVIGRR